MLSRILTMSLAALPVATGSALPALANAGPVPQQVIEIAVAADDLARCRETLRSVMSSPVAQGDVHQATTMAPGPVVRCVVAPTRPDTNG